MTFEFKENRYYFNGLCGLKLIDRKRNAKPESLEIETAPFPMITLEDVKTVFDNDLPWDNDNDEKPPF